MITFDPLKPLHLPFTRAFIPVVPCVLDGCLSLLELISKLQYAINQYTDAINTNAANIAELAARVEEAITDLRAYVDTQDAATLTAAKNYADSLDAALRQYVDTQDAATLASAKSYADGLDAAVRHYVDNQVSAALASAKSYADGLEAALRQYVDTQDAATLSSAKSYADGLDAALRQYVNTQDTATLAAAKSYADGLDTAVRQYIAAQLLLKQDVLTFDSTPTDQSLNPVTSSGIFAALAQKQQKYALITLSENSGTYSVNMTASEIQLQMIRGVEYEIHYKVIDPITEADISYDIFRFQYWDTTSIVFGNNRHTVAINRDDTVTFT